MFEKMFDGVKKFGETVVKDAQIIGNTTAKVFTDVYKDWLTGFNAMFQN